MEAVSVAHAVADAELGDSGGGGSEGFTVSSAGHEDEALLREPERFDGGPVALAFDDEFIGNQFDGTRIDIGIDHRRLALDHLAGHGDHALEVERTGLLKEGAAGVNDDLRATIVVPQIEEENSAVIALVVNPPGKPGGFSIPVSQVLL